MAQIKPLGNQIVVERKERETKKGSILLPETAKEKPRQGKVLAVGPGKYNEKGNLQAMEVHVGDEIFFSSYAGTEYLMDEQELLILSQDDVLAIVQ